MPRHLTIAAAQSGPVPRSQSRAEVVVNQLGEAQMKTDPQSGGFFEEGVEG